MPIFSRFSRWIKSIFGGALSSVENPRLILEQNIRELNDQVPKMNENIATVKANVIMLEKEVRKLEKEVEQLTSKVKAAIQADRDDIAQKHAMRLEKARASLDSTREQMNNASAAYDKALQVKKTFMREKEKKIQEAKEAMRAHERAQWQAEIADTLEQFEVAGTDQTHDEMIQRMNEETARHEARMEMALDSVDTEAMQIEEDAEELRAAELVKQFKLEMGVDEREEQPRQQEEAAVDLPEDEQAEERAKTIGRQRTQSE